MTEVTEDLVREIVDELLSARLPKYGDSEFRSGLPPSDNQVERFNKASGKYEPTTLTAIAGSVSVENSDTVIQSIADTLDFQDSFVVTAVGTEVNIALKAAHTGSEHHDATHLLNTHPGLLHSVLTTTTDDHHLAIHGHDANFYIPFGDDPNFGQTFAPA